MKLKEWYSETFHCPGYIVDYLVYYDVLGLIAEGYSRDNISERCDVPVEEIKKISLWAYKFPGWDRDLDYFPLKIYTRYSSNFYTFVSEVIRISPVTTAEIAKQSYKVCEKFEWIERQLLKYD